MRREFLALTECVGKTEQSGFYTKDTDTVR